MDMQKKCGNPWNDTRASHTFSRKLQWESSNLQAHICYASLHPFDLKIRRLITPCIGKGATSLQQSSAVTACIQANVSPPFNRHAVCTHPRIDKLAICHTVKPGLSLLSIFSTTSSTSLSCMNFTLMPSIEPRDGPSAMLLKEGTLAYQALTPEESSRARSSATNSDPGEDLARPDMLTSRVALLSMKKTQGLFLNCFFQIAKQTRSAKSSASKMTVDFPGYPSSANADLFNPNDRAAIWRPQGSTRTPPMPHGQDSLSGLKEASVNTNIGMSQVAVTSRGREETKLLLNILRKWARPSSTAEFLEAYA